MSELDSWSFRDGWSFEGDMIWRPEGAAVQELPLRGQWYHVTPTLPAAVEQYLYFNGVLVLYRRRLAIPLCEAIWRWLILWLAVVTLTLWGT